MKIMPWATTRSWVILVGVTAMFLTGCDYWPPALLAQLEQLRTHVQDLSDDRAELEAQLRASTLAKEELHGQVDQLRRENQTLRKKLARHAGRTKGGGKRVARAQGSRPPRGIATTSVSRSSERVLEVRQPRMHGRDVLEAQQALDRIGVPVTVDGVYGTDTRAAVVWFQRKHGIPADGAVGPRTRAALTKVSSSKATPRVVRLSKPHMRGSDVKKIQKALRYAGLSVRVDGTFGSGTHAAVKSFQRKQGLRADGVVGPATRQALGLS